MKEEVLTSGLRRRDIFLLFYVTRKIEDVCFSCLIFDFSCLIYLQSSVDLLILNFSFH